MSYNYILKNYSLRIINISQFKTVFKKENNQAFENKIVIDFNEIIRN